jgi:hypothetical protein
LLDDWFSVLKNIGGTMVNKAKNFYNANKGKLVDWVANKAESYIPGAGTLAKSAAEHLMSLG